MPDTYAHYRFGREVLELLPPKEQEVIHNDRRLYDIGLHGPDPLFYYRPLSHHPLHALAGRMHRVSGQQFFEQTGLTLCSRGEPGPDRAYLYGFLCHFVLDSACHGLVIRTSEEGTLRHEEIESSFDRLLLVLDGLDPLRTDRAESLRLSAEEKRRCAAVMAAYFPGIRPGQLGSSVSQMAFCNRLLMLPDPGMRRAVEQAMRVIGRYDSLHGHIVPAGPDPRCAQTDTELLELYQGAVPDAVALITGYLDCARGNTPWPERYQYNFVSEPVR